MEINHDKGDGWSKEKQRRILSWYDRRHQITAQRWCTTLRCKCDLAPFLGTGILCSRAKCSFKQCEAWGAYIDSTNQEGVKSGPLTVMCATQEQRSTDKEGVKSGPLTVMCGTQEQRSTNQKGVKSGPLTFMCGTQEQRSANQKGFKSGPLTVMCGT